jgi:phage gp29-like protein
MTDTPEQKIDVEAVYAHLAEPPSPLRGMTADRLMSIISLAENGSTGELFALYRDVIASDSQIQSDFGKRKDAVLGDTASLIPWDKLQPADVDAKDLCQTLMDAAPFNTATEWLLNSTLYPVAVCEKIYSPSLTGGYTLSKIVPVPYQLLDYSKGALRIFNVDANATISPTSHAVDPQRYIVHRGHTMPMPDNWGGPLRSLLFWWLLKTMSRQWWADLLERFGLPFFKGKYNDAAGKAVLERAFSLAQKLGGIVISKATEVEIVQAAAGDSSASHERFITLCNKEISKLIVGQTLSSQSDPTGIGSGASELQGEVRDDIRKKDARRLGITLRTQLFSQFCLINGKYGKAPIILFGSDSAAEMRSLVLTIKELHEAGFEPDDDGIANISERLGFGIRRKVAMPAFPFSAVPLAATQTNLSRSVAEESAPDLAAAFTGRYSPLADIINASTSTTDCIKGCRDWLRSQDLADAGEILAEAMSAYAYSALHRPRN